MTRYVVRLRSHIVVGGVVTLGLPQFLCLAPYTWWVGSTTEAARMSRAEAARHVIRWDVRSDMVVDIVELEDQ